MLLTGFFFNSCKNPTDDIEILFDASVIKYKASLMVNGASGETIPGLTAQVTGADAANIYDFAGTKALFSPGGIITMGVHYKFEPTAAKPVNFNVILKAPGYEDANIPVSIMNGQMTQLVRVTLLKTNQNTTASTYATVNANLTGNATTAVTTLTTASTTDVPTTTTITIPVGTQFKDANNVALTGTQLTSTIINYDTTDPKSLGLFPGGDLSASNVVLTTNGTPTPAFFLPAGFASVKMFVGASEVKNFTTPIAVSIQLDPNYKLLNGTAIAAGSTLPIFSYDVSTGQFKSEGTGTVTSAGGKLMVNFTTSHLTVFVVGEVSPTTTCKPVNINFAASWLNDGSRPVKVNFSTAADVLVASIDMVISNGFQATVAGLPDAGLKYSVLDASNNNEVLATGTVASTCGGPTVNASLKAPSIAIENVTLTLNVKCPGKGTILIPNFDIYFRPVGSTNYNILGTASAGLIKTTLLKRGAAYDFKAVWGNDEKIVSNRIITDADMSTTVGDGALSPENSALLIQACK